MKSENILISSDSRQLEAGIVYPERRCGESCAVLFIHGKKSNQELYRSRAEEVSRSLGAVTLTFDLSGHGRDSANFRTFTVADHLNDVVAAYDRLARTSAVDANRIGVCGASYGGFLASLLTEQRTVARLVLRAPAIAHGVKYDSDEAAGHWSELPEPYDSIRALSTYAGNTLIIESELDEVVPSAHVAAYLNASDRTSHRVIAGASHAMSQPAWDAEFVNATVSWFKAL